ncbi:MAG: hypothetical protein K6E12_07370 [Saccharofermentans sp.]|nr:hypothetical protein [Saccharofermentans sp.]
MANTGKRSSSTSSRGSKKSTSKSSRSNASRKTTKSSPATQESAFSRIVSKFAASKAAMPLIFIAAVILLVGIDLLISWDNFGTFFTILGVETLIAVVVWVIMTLVFSRRSAKESDSEPAEDEV